MQKAVFNRRITKNRVDVSIDELFQAFLIHLQKEHNITPGDFSEMLHTQIMIPVSIFDSPLSALEVIVKYLVEVKGFNNKQIAELLNRNIRTIWSTYRNAKIKYPKKLRIDPKNRFFIPISIFSDREYSMLEAIVRYLRSFYNIPFNRIAELLNRKTSTVWTVFNRARIKQKNAE